MESVARVACQHASAASKRHRWCMGSGSYLLGTAQAPIGADLSSDDALSKALHAGMQHRQCVRVIRTRVRMESVARAACPHASAASKRHRWCMGSGGYLLGTAQAPIGADLSSDDALSKALHAGMQHRHCVRVTIESVARAACPHASAASKRHRWCMESGAYLLGTAQAPIGADLSSDDALSKALHAGMQHRQNVRVRMESVARAACPHASAASKRHRWCMGSGAYLLGTAQAPIGADLSSDDALSKALHAGMHHRQNVRVRMESVARVACPHASAASKRHRWCMGSGGYLLGTAQAPIGADLSSDDALSKALHAGMHHRQNVRVRMESFARVACPHASAASKRHRWCMGSGGYLLGTAQAPIGADLSSDDALSKALHAGMQHRQNVRVRMESFARVACPHASAASKRHRWCMGSGSYLLGTAQAPIGADLSSDDALSKALHAGMQHRQCVRVMDGIGCTCGLPTRQRRKQAPPLVHGQRGYLLGTAQAPIGADLSSDDALSKALHAGMQHRQG